MTARFLAITLAALIFGLVLELVRREKMTFKYASSWLTGSLLALVMAYFDGLLSRFAALLGFELTSNFVFFTLLIGFVFLSLLLTLFLCQQNERNDRMSQKIGMMEYEIEELKKKRAPESRP